VYLCVLCGEIFIKEFTTEDTKVHRGILRMEVSQGLPRRRGQERFMHVIVSRNG
jgi:hypothetical protein